MKKMIFFASALVFTLIVVISSCTKAEEDNPTSNWNCHCTITSSTGTHAIDIAQSGMTKSEATANCSTAQYNYNSGGNTATCTLQ
jgi:hypothetical protein